MISPPLEGARLLQCPRCGRLEWSEADEVTCVGSAADAHEAAVMTLVPSEPLDLDARLRGRALPHLESLAPRTALFGPIFAWFATLSLWARIVVSAVALFALATLARLLNRPSFDLNVERTYGFTARRNTDGIGLPIPIVYGELRVFPHVVQEYIDTELGEGQTGGGLLGGGTATGGGGTQILYRLMAVSEGPIGGMSEVEINEQPISNFQGVSYQVRLGLPEQTAIPWFQDIRNTYAVDVDLLSNGRKFTYRTRTPVNEFLVRIGFPQGLLKQDGSANSVTFRIEHRRYLLDTAWTSLGDFAVNGVANDTKAIVRQYASGAIGGGIASKRPGAAANDASLGGTAWTDPDKALVPDDQWAAVDEPTATPRDTQLLLFTDFDFGELPGDATILGVQVEVERHHGPFFDDDWLPEGPPESTYDRSVRLYVDGAFVGENKADLATAWPRIDTVKSYGGTSDLWGLPSLSVAQVQGGADFGFGIAARVDAGTARIDAATLKVFYTSAAQGGAVRREIRVTRLSTAGTPHPPMSWLHVDELTYGAQTTTYPHVALLGVKAQASEQLSGSPAISAFVRGRLVRHLEGGALSETESWSANPVECLIDLLTSRRYGLGGWIPDDLLALARWQGPKDYCDEPLEDDDTRHRMDLVLDEMQTPAEMVDILLHTFRGFLVEEDGLYRLAVDHLTPVTQVFSDANIKRGTFETTWAPISERFEAVELFFLDRDNNYIRDSVVWPPGSESAEKKKTVDGRGIVRRSQALREARYHYHVMQRTRTVSFAAATEAVSVGVADVVKVSHALPQAGDPTSPWAFRGRVMGVATDGGNHVITVDTARLPTAGLESFGLLVRLQTDEIQTRSVLAVSAPFETAEGYPRQTVTVEGLFSPTPAIRDSLWCFGPVAEVGVPFRIMEIAMTDRLDRQLRGVEYDASIFEPLAPPECTEVAVFTRPTVGISSPNHTGARGIVDGDRVMWWVKGSNGAGGIGNAEAWTSHNRGADWTFTDLGFTGNAQIRGGFRWQGQYVYTRVFDGGLYLSTDGVTWVLEPFAPGTGFQAVPNGTDLYGFSHPATTATTIWRRTGASSWTNLGGLPGGYDSHSHITQIPGLSEVLLLHRAGGTGRDTVSRLELPGLVLKNQTAPLFPGEGAGLDIEPALSPISATHFLSTQHALNNVVKRSLDGGSTWHNTLTPTLASGWVPRMSAPFLHRGRVYAVLMRQLDNSQVHVASIAADETEWALHCDYGAVPGTCLWTASGLNSAGHLDLYAMFREAGSPNDTYRVVRTTVP